MRESREFICVTCPVGCTIQAKVEDGKLLSIEGNTCSRGIDFVEEELTAPKRMLTTTVQVRGGTLPLVPVRTVEAIPKNLLLEVARVLRDTVVDAPVEAHQVVLADALGCGVDVVTSRSMERSRPDGASTRD